MINRSRESVTDVSLLGVEDSLSSSKSETPCWTCRRRRVQCDRALPTCTKCHHAGKDCLGYKKPLVWNKGVASRGKMMGKSFNQPKPTSKPIEETTGDWRQCPSDISGSQRSGTPSSQTADDSEKTEWTVSIVPRVENSVHGMLIDPIFQDLKPITRYYLDYFCHKLCPEAVLHDLPGQNPFRDLISTVGSSPLLLKSMLAAAARHATNYTSYSAAFSPSWVSASVGSSDELQLTPKSSRYHAYWYKQVALTQLRRDLESSTGSGVENDVIVASISLLIWIDLLEAGKNTWRIHLEGMKKVIGLKDSSTSLPTTPSTTSSSITTTTHPYFFDTCVIFDIMGTTLSRPYKINKPLPPTATVQNSLFRAEKISFIGCPAELLCLILIINWKCWIRNQSSMSAANFEDSSPSSTHFSDVDIRTGTEYEEYTDVTILNRIKAFDPISWAYNTTLYVPEPDTQERVHLASAYQNAILIYYHRVLSPFLTSATSMDSSNTSSPSLLGLVRSTLDNLSQIGPTHAFIKSIVWPTFIAGAELLSAPKMSSNFHPDPVSFDALTTFRQYPLTSSNPNESESTNYRQLTRHLLHTFWNGYHSVNVINAAHVLEEIWKKNDIIVNSMSPQEHAKHEKAGIWSRGVLNCAELGGVEADEKNGGKDKGEGWKDFWVGGDVDWLFV